MEDSLKNIYKFHHKKERPEDFSIMEKERGLLLKNEIGRGKEILDMGCRDGVLTKYFIDGNNVLGVDIDEESLINTKNKLKINTQLLDLNSEWEILNNKKFDVIVAGEVLEHLYYPEKVIDKVTKHLKSEGLFMGSVPNAFSAKNKLRYLKGSKKHTPLSDPTHINHFSYKELEQILRKRFREVKIIGLGRYKYLSQKFPSFFSFMFFFVAKNKK